MRKPALCALLIFSMLATTGYAQFTSDYITKRMQGPAVGPRDISAFQNIVNINGQDGFYLKKDLYLTESYTVINGEQVLGIPFLYMNWLNGSISTQDGRIYPDYKLKYNVYDQTLFFLNGKDSMEVNEDIKEFILTVTWRDSTMTSRFVNSNQYQKGKIFYYEVLLDEEEGQLLKTNQKVLGNIANGIIGSGSKKYLNLESAYFYFDKKTKKISKIKSAASITSMLHLTEEQASKLQVEKYDLSKEPDIIQLLKLYFQQSSLKGF